MHLPTSAGHVGIRLARYLSPRSGAATTVWSQTVPALRMTFGQRSIRHPKLAGSARDPTKN
jgi:hypothetical protein